MNQPQTEAQEAPAENPEVEADQVETGAEATAEGNDSDGFLVIDSSVNEDNPVREHEIIVKGQIIPVVFRLGEPKILPFEHAMKFMKDGFTVKEVNGSDINLPAVPTDSVSAQLAPDETVAKYSELTFSALKLRAAQKSDGDIYLEAKEEDRLEIISFLMGEVPAVEVDTVEADDGDRSEEIDVTEPKITPDPDALAKKIDGIIRHFGEGLENVTSREVGEHNGAIVYAIVHVDPDAGEKVLVQGTLAELHQATIEGKNAGRFNSDQDAKAPVVEPVGDEDVANALADEGTEPNSPDGEEGQAHDHPPAPEADTDEVATDETVAEGNEEEGEADAEEPTFTIDEVEGATDEAMRLAVENGIDLKDVEGTGENGNVLVGDVEAYIEKNFPKEGEAVATPDAE